MRKILIYPVHRRYINLLKSLVSKNTPILITRSDCEKIYKLISRTSKAGERHRGLYRLTFQIINRPLLETKEMGVVSSIGYDEIGKIEQILAKVERRCLWNTLLGTLIWYCTRRHR